MGAILVFFRVC